MEYINNGLKTYVELLYKQYYSREDVHFVFKLFLIAPILAWQTLKDAAVELIFLVLFWLIIMKMSQGRDLIVSLFEPGGLYGYRRVIFTTLAVTSLSVSMWIIPAFLFQKQENRKRAADGFDETRSPFRQHLFFMHRVLPLIPFWLLAMSLFNISGWWFVGFAVVVMLLLTFLNTPIKKSKLRRQLMLIIGLILILSTLYFFRRFQVEYTSMKIIYAINLYLLSILMFLVYHNVDAYIEERHKNPVYFNRSSYNRYRANTVLYACIFGAHILVILFIYFRPFRISIAPESLLLYMFSVYVFAIDFLFYFFSAGVKRQLVFAFVAVAGVLLVATGLWKANVNHYTMDKNPTGTSFKGRARDNFADRYAELKFEIEANKSEEPYPIVLVSGEGGGSRAGLWLSQNLINFDYETMGKFRNHIFSISTVSGSSVGLSTVFSYWDKTRYADRTDSAWLKFPAEIYANNFVGSSIRGLLLTDLYKSIVPGNWTNDRNTTLQTEEAEATTRSMFSLFNDERTNDRMFPDSAMSLKKDFMYYFYEQRDGALKYRQYTPITLINTCRSNDGRRGIISSIRLSDRYFNDAIDISGYLYDDSLYTDENKKISVSRKKPISLGQACNTSELFPLFSAPVYIDSLGSFVDGGYHENSGLKSTLEIYQQLSLMLDNDPPSKKYRIYIVYLKNGAGEKQLYKPRPSEPTALQPLKTLFSQPFEGSASYFEERAKFIGAVDSLVSFIPVTLNPRFIVDSRYTGVVANPAKRKLEEEILKDLINKVDVNEDGAKDTILNFPLARWLSKTVINRILVNAAPNNMSPQVKHLLGSVRTVNAVSRPSNLPFDQFPEHDQLKASADTVTVPKLPSRNKSKYY
ncbi:MAG: hypothetical protein ABW174_10675 [Flavitalea sp.]